MECNNANSQRSKQVREKRSWLNDLEKLIKKSKTVANVTSLTNVKISETIQADTSLTRKALN
ncbi:hypothetical protein MXB_1661 [Myxobolus squamalis]|nr:hypothetical protein MXB_1661 [Myxobolus squamalis]